MGNAAGLNKGESSYGTIDFSEIRNVLDITGKDNYTFRVINHPESSETVFFNLVMIQRDTYTTVMLVKYEMDPAFAEAYYSRSKDFTQFSGTVSYSLVSSNDPCPPVPPKPTTTTGGGSDGPPNPYPDQGSDSDSSLWQMYMTIYYAEHAGDSANNGSGNSNDTNDSDGDGNHAPWVWHKYSMAINSQNAMKDPCDKGNNIGILPPEAYESFYNFFVGLPDDLENWLRNQPNQLSSYLFHYLYDNGFSDESKEFAMEMIKALINGIDVNIPNHIIYAFDKPCQKQVVKDIIDNCSPFTNMIYQTFNTDDKANIKFTNGPTSSGNPAETSTVYTGGATNPIINIKLDNTYLDNATNLSIVANTLHELVHAYLMNLYIKGTLVATNPQYETLLNAYIVFYANKTQANFNTLDDAMHNSMANFINQMANSIYNYAFSKNIPGVTSDYCIKLAWGTMNGYNLFTTTLTLSQQQEYETIAAIEQDNISGAKGSSCP